MRSSSAFSNAGGSLTAIPIESFPRAGISPAAWRGVISFARYSDSYTFAPAFGELAGSDLDRGHLVLRASGRPIGVFAQQLIYAGLGMMECGVNRSRLNPVRNFHSLLNFPVM